MTIYLVESVDRVGKTTLCEMLSRELKCKVFHDEYKPFYLTDNSLLENNDALFNELLETKFNVLIQTLSLFDNIVVDRFHLTEVVYDLFRGQEFKAFEKVDRLLSRLNVKLILVQPDDIKESSRQHGSDLSLHQVSFNMFYNFSAIKNKLIVKQSDIFNNPNDTLERIIWE
jgi:thymidylate kinase